MTNREIEEIFTYHAPKGDQPITYQALRQAGKSFALAIQAYCPESREKSLALTAVQQAVMWANAAVAIHEQASESSGSTVGSTRPEAIPAATDPQTFGS